MLRKARSRFPILLCAWIALIFGTSCTVIRPHEFFKLVATITSANRESLQRFELFWGVSWFAIVKGWHVAEFAVLTLLTAAALKWWRGKLTAATILRAMLLCIAFAASDEWHQSFIPDRFGTFQDVMIDSIGICVAGLAMLARQNRRIARECRSSNNEQRGS